MREEWRDIIGYEGYYQISNKGRVFSLPRYIPNSRRMKKGNFMKTYISVGRLRVRFSKDGIYKTKTVNELVYEAFIGISEKPKKHNNGDIKDCSVGNLSLIETCSKYKYVTKDNRKGKRKKRWRAEIRNGKKMRCLGWYLTEIEAKQAIDEFNPRQTVSERSSNR